MSQQGVPNATLTCHKSTLHPHPTIQIIIQQARFGDTRDVYETETGNAAYYNLYSRKIFYLFL